MGKDKTNASVSKTSQLSRSSESEEDKSKDLDRSEIQKDVQPLADTKSINPQSSEKSETIVSHLNTEAPSIQEDIQNYQAKPTNEGHTQSFQEPDKDNQQKEHNQSQNNLNGSQAPEQAQGTEDIKTQIINQLNQEKESKVTAEVTKGSQTKKEEISEQLEEKHSKESSNYQPEEENDAEPAEADDWRPKKQRNSGIKIKRKRTNQSSLQDNGNNSFSNENQNKVVERKRGIRDLTTDEKWGVYDKYQFMQSYRGVGREFNMDHSTVKLLIQRIKNEQPEGEPITKEMFLQGDIAKQGQEPIITKKLKKELMKAQKNHLNSELHSSGHDQMDGQVHLFDQDLNFSDGNQNEAITQQSTKQKKLRMDKKESQGEFYYQDGDKCIQNEGSMLDDPTQLPSLHSSKSKTKLSTEEKELRKKQRIEKRILKQDEKEIKKSSKGKGTLGDIANNYGYSVGQQSKYPNQSLDNQQAISQIQQIPQNPFLDPSHEDIHNIFPGFFANSLIKYPNVPGGEGQLLNQYVYAQNIAAAQQHLPYPFLTQFTQQQQQDDFDHIIDNIDIHAQAHAMPQENANLNTNQNGHNFDDEIQLELS